MDPREGDLPYAALKAHWYYAAKARAMTGMLGSCRSARVLDVGAGSGFFSRYLLEAAGAAEAWCVDPGYSADRPAENHGGKPARYLRSIGDVPADIVLMMDVLEHVDDDVGLIAEYTAKVPAGTRFLITVPAFEALWSGHDDFLGHKRRYTIGRLESAVRGGGLQVERSCYFFGAVLPIAAMVRLLQRLIHRSRPARSQMKRHHPVVNAALSALSALELPWFRHNRLAGLTVVCLASTPPKSPAAEGQPGTVAAIA